MHILTRTQSEQMSTLTSLFITLTNGGLAEFLIRHLVGDICSHQHAHLDAQLLMNDLWDELQSIRSFIHPLNEPTCTVIVCYLCQMWQSCDLRKQLSSFFMLSKKENATEMTFTHNACIHECTGPWWVTFQARPVWFCPSWCHKYDRWIDVESQRAECQRSWQRRADLAPPPVSEREERTREE